MSAPPEDGFSLVEVVIALVVFAVGILGVAGMTNFAAQTMNDARATAWAVGVAGEVADSLGHWGVTEGGERLLREGRVTWAVEEVGPPARVTIRVEPVRIRSRFGDDESGTPSVRIVVIVPGPPISANAEPAG